MKNLSWKLLLVILKLIDSEDYKTVHSCELLNLHIFFILNILMDTIAFLHFCLRLGYNANAERQCDS